MNKRTSKALPDKEIEDRRAKGLCFLCDERFVPGHRCNRKLYNLEIRVEDVSDELDNEEVSLIDMDVPPHPVQVEEPEPLISLHALTGESAFQTLKAVGTAGKQQILILVDSGSSHNFMDTELVVKLNCPLHDVKPFQVSMADGNSITGQKG